MNDGCGDVGMAWHGIKRYTARATDFKLTANLSIHIFSFLFCILHQLARLWTVFPKTSWLCECPERESMRPDAFISANIVVYCNVIFGDGCRVGGIVGWREKEWASGSMAWTYNGIVLDILSINQPSPHSADHQHCLTRKMCKTFN